MIEITCKTQGSAQKIVGTTCKTQGPAQKQIEITCKICVIYDGVLFLPSWCWLLRLVRTQSEERTSDAVTAKVSARTQQER